MSNKKKARWYGTFSVIQRTQGEKQPSIATI